MKKGLVLSFLAVLAVLSLASAYSVVAEQSSYPIKIGYVKAKQIWVPQYSKVDVYVTVQNTGGTSISGDLKVEIRKDIENWWDETYTTLYEYISLGPYESKEVKVGEFYANDLTGQNGFREYFVKVYFNDKCIYDPTDPNTREWVKTYKK